MSWTDDKNNEQYELLHNIYKRLKNETDSKGRNLKIHKIQLPDQINLTKSESEELDIVDSSFNRLDDTDFIATYVNCYICNGGVVIPKFNDKQDEVALKQFQSLFPNRKIVQVYTREISVGGGNIHCITQQQP